MTEDAPDAPAAETGARPVSALAADPNRQRAWREALVVGATAAAVYGLTLSAVPALTHDSMGYMLAIESGGDALYHPHHLAYNLLARGWLDAAGILGLDRQPLRAVEMLNALFGACVAALVWTILRMRACASCVLAAAGTAGACLSYGVWFNSVSVEVYVLPLACLLATTLALTAPHLTPRGMVTVGVLNGLAVLGHQVNVLFAVVVIAYVARVTPARAARRLIGAYGAAASGVVVAAYGTVLWLGVGATSPSAAADWLTRYAQDGGYWHARPSAPVHAAVGFARSFVGGHFAYRLSTVRERAMAAFPSKSLADEAFLVRDLPPVLAVALIVLAVLGAALLGIVLVRGVSDRRRGSAPAGHLVRALVLWLLTYGAFFVVWEPINPEFWIPQVVVVWMIAAALTAAPASGRRDSAHPAGRAAALVAAAVAIGTANLLGTVLPASTEANDYYAYRYAALAHIVREGDLVIVDHPHLGLGYTLRYTEATPVAVSGYTFVVSMEEERGPTPGELAHDVALATAAGHRVAVDASLIHQPSGDAAARAGARLSAQFGDAWRLTEVPEADGWYVIDA